MNLQSFHKILEENYEKEPAPTREQLFYATLKVWVALLIAPTKYRADLCLLLLHYAFRRKQEVQP